MRLILALTLLTAMFVLTQCKTTESSLLDGDSPGAKCAPPLSWYAENGVQKLSTAELGAYLKQRVEQQQWPCDIHVKAASRRFGISLPEDESQHREFFESRGGFFGGRVQLDTPNGQLELPIYDNKMRYLWSLDAGGGDFLPPEKWFNNIIPLRRGNEQPELERFIKDGDVIAYFSPDNRSQFLDAYNQYRSGHSATIMERIGEDGERSFVLIDTPGAYATPINGLDPTPFHVFRVVPRTSEGQAYPERDILAYGQQTSRWGALALDRFPFEGDYGVLTFKAADQIDDYALRYLATQFPQYDNSGLEIRPMYCAWYSYQNMTLGYMRPMNEQGLRSLMFSPSGAQPRPFYDVLREGDRGYQFPRIQGAARFGDNTFNQYFAAPQHLKPHNDFVFPPVTAPELVLNFLDRTIGPDAWVPEEMWPQHATLRSAILENGMRGFLQHFRTSPDPRFLEGGSGELSEESYEIYNSQLESEFSEVLSLYQQSISLSGNELLAKRGAIQQRLWTLIENERNKPRIPRKWIPPYVYIREADNFESFYRPQEGENGYQPQLVYVGTVVPEALLKDWGAQEEDMLMVVGLTEQVEQDWRLYSEVPRMLRLMGSDVPENKSPVDAMLFELFNQCLGEDPETCSGLNLHEVSALLAMRNHWNDALLWNEDQNEGQIWLHNEYGLDDVLLLRALVSYWNNPRDFRAAIYEGDASTISSAVTNLRIIMSSSSVEMVAPTERVLTEHLGDGHPRRVSPLHCRSDNPTAVTRQHRRCGEIERSDYFFIGGGAP